MTEKSTGKFILQLERLFADSNPILLQTAKAYHELDQINYDLGLINMDDSVASKISWWPLITVIGSPTSGKTEFVNQYLQREIFPLGMPLTNTRFSVLFQSDNDQLVTLPGTAVDRDPRFPFYHASDKIESIKQGEGRQINSYMELKTCNCRSLNGKIIISAPGFVTDREDMVTPFLTEQIAEKSDLVLVFFDAADTDLEPLKASLTRFIETVNNARNPDKFVFIINQQDPDDISVDLTFWKNRLAEYGLISGRFFFLQKPVVNRPAADNRLFAQVTDHGQSGHAGNTDFKTIEKLMDNVSIDSAYRIVGSLEHSIHEVDEIVMHEVRKGIKLWKNRVHFTITLILTFLALLLVMAEIETGFLAFFIDPIVGPVSLVVLIAIMIPIHIYASKQHAKWVINELQQKQKELGLIENIAGVFEKNMTFWRIMLPITEPAGWNKDIKLRLSRLLDRSKELIQSLNDSFSSTGSDLFM